MERLRILRNNEKDVVFLNMRDYDEDKIFYREILHRATEILSKKDDPQLLLADFSGIAYTHKLFEITRDFISANLDAIRAAAITGVQLEQEIDPDIVKKAAELHILFFSDLNEAKNWLYKK